MKLINADEVIRDLASLKYSKEYGKVGATYNLAIDDCIGEIVATPTALYAEALGAEPVRHAHWIINTPTGAKGKPDFVCSSCFCISPVRGYTLYCPHCGAKMDGEVEVRKK